MEKIQKKTQMNGNNRSPKNNRVKQMKEEGRCSCVGKKKREKMRKKKPVREMVRISESYEVREASKKKGLRNPVYSMGKNQANKAGKKEKYS